MKKIFFFICFALSITLIFEKSDASTVNTIVVKVGNKVITNYEVKNKILTTLINSNKDINQKNIDLIKSQTLENLIILRLKQIELNNYKIKLDKEKVNLYLNQLSGNNIENLKKKFTTFSINFDYFVEEITTELEWREFIYKKYSRKIEIDHQTNDEEIEKIIEASLELKEINLSEIEIFHNNRDNDTVISKILLEIDKNGFEDTALKFSNSSSSSNKGNLGWISSNSLSKEIFNIINKLKLGQISEPIIKPNSILFLKLNDERKVSANEIDKENLKRNLINTKKNEIFNLYSNSYLSKLRNEHLIEYY
tara:strand:+ start:5703 stop:6629 length:927 start_codon:yes stop_codon:yes gene_type:complete